MFILLWFIFHADLSRYKTYDRSMFTYSLTAKLPDCLLGMCTFLFVQVFEEELPETVQDIWDQLTEEPDRVPDSNWRFASPKSLMDNLCHTMYCLFSECFTCTEVQRDCEYTREDICTMILHGLWMQSQIQNSNKKIQLYWLIFHFRNIFFYLCMHCCV